MWPAIRAQSLVFNLEHFGLEEGMPARMAYEIIQDQDGFIWFCTQLGIHRFDGKRFKTFTNSELEIPGRNPARLAIDSKNQLWFSSPETSGIPAAHGVLDLATGRRMTIQEATGGLVQDSQVVVVSRSNRSGGGVLILLHGGFLFRYDQQLESLGQFKMGSARHVGLFPISENEYWCQFGTEMFRIAPGGSSDTIDLPPDAGKELISAFSLGKTPILKSMKRDEIIYFKYRNGQFFRYTLPGPKEEKFRQLILDGPEYTVVAISDSIVVFDLAGNRLFAAPAFRDHPSTDPNRIYRTFVDRQSNLWIGSVDGIYKLTAKPNRFSVIFPGVSIYGMLRQDSTIWLAGHPSLLGLGPKGEKIPKSDARWFCRGLFEDSKNRMWFSIYQMALQRYDPASGTWDLLALDQGQLIVSLTENPVTGDIWAGTANGIWKLKEDPTNFANSKLENIQTGSAIADMKVYQFHHNHEGIWVVGSKGLLLIDPKSETLVASYGREVGFPITDFNHLHEDGDGIFWLGTRGGGLVRWDRTNGTIEQLSMEDGLSNDNVYAVYEDDFGVLWLPSDYGLMAFDKESRNVRVYHTQNGIAHEEFNTGSHYRDADGTFYFGGMGGITAFHPRDLRASPVGDEPPLHINRVSILDNRSDAFQDRSIEFRDEKKIVLEPDDQALRIELSFLDFEKPGQNQLAYRLLGYQQNWVYPDGEVISYMNLPYGSYELEIRARGASGDWTQEILTIPVVVKRPFYLQTWFLLCAIVLLILVIVGIVQWRLLALRRERVRLEREVRSRTATITAQAEELKELDKLKSNFFANITHEIRTPLTLLIGPVEELLDKEQNPETRKSLSGIRRNARNLLNLLNQLLDISKLEHRQMMVEVARGDLKAFTSELLEQFMPIAERKGLSLSFSPKLETEAVFFDPDKWSKIIFNLVSNAVKFTEANGSIQVVLEDAEMNGCPALKLVVEDDGIGIRKADQAKIFDRFYQADGSSTRSYGGTGIGLSLVKELVELQGGTIAIESEAGTGARFIVVIPIPEGPAPKDLEESSQPAMLLAESYQESEFPTVQESGSVDQLTLLLIEDDAELRSFIRSCIDESKYKVIEAADGQEGLEIALETIPDLIISDVMMPRKDGYEVVEAVRGHVATSHIPLILLTAKASLESRLEGLNRGADAYLTKPFVPIELKTRIDKLIEIRQLLRKRYRLPSRVEEVALSPQPDQHFQQEDDFMERLKEFIQENLSNPDLKVDLVAREFGLSRTQFYRKLSSIADLGVTDLIRSARCEKALELIRTRQWTLAEIAYEVGYSSPGHFSRSFRKLFGIAPSEVLRDEEREEKV